MLSYSRQARKIRMWTWLQKKKVIRHHRPVFKIDYLDLSFVKEGYRISEEGKLIYILHKRGPVPQTEKEFLEFVKG